ncbi:MAG: DNA translocase FtsK 4TM domain-containing protein, partial [Octadecabacter sp.]|nr:DNA translocase FtsK 4TM domain-containing protein [Octadecabacter sp.]
MAYQTRQRDPLLDSETQAILMRRGQEAIGLGLIALGLALAMMLLSYTPDDPRLWDATDLVPQNMFGRFGATVSTFAIMGTGFGAALLPLSLVVWGLRYVLHLNSEPALWRLIFLP